MRKLVQAILLVPIALAVLLPAAARADEVTDWNQVFFRAALIGASTPLVVTRQAAIVQASVFDTVNGIARRYTPIHVAPAGPAGASKDAAAAQAAYTALVALFPTQKATFDARLAVSMQEIGSHESSASVAAGVAWGTTVANAIMAWRAADGFTPAPPPFLGGTAVGQWRPTPPAFASGAGPQFATMVPWVILAHDQFRPAGPPALDSARYTKDFIETKMMGSISSTTRTSDQTVASWFWAAGSASYDWNTVAMSLIDRGDDDGDHDWDRDGHSRHHSSTLDNARLFAQLNLAIADAAIGCWDAKYTFVFWRPVTAIPLADTDGNPATIADPAWMPLFATPAHPEYPSGHSCLSGAATAVLADQFGEHSHFTVTNDLMPGVERSFKSFTSALNEVKNARIFAGIHFRAATDDGTALGASVASYVLENAMQKLP